MEGEILNNSLMEIYSFDDNTKLYSTFPRINFQSEKSLISLNEALSNKQITLEDILSEMKLKATANDGGSIWYEFSKKDGNLANQNFILVKCNSLEINGGNKNIYIGNDEKILTYCIEKD